MRCRRASALKRTTMGEATVLSRKVNVSEMSLSPACATLKIPLYLSMILGANFESESGPEIPLNMSLILKFGGHVTTKQGTTWLFANEKGSHLWHISTHPRSNGVAQTVPESFLPQRCRGSSAVLLPVQRLPRPATAFPTPGAGCCFNATPSQGRAGGAEAGCGRARLGLDWCGTLEQPHGRLLPAARCGQGLRQCRIRDLGLLPLPFGLLQSLTKAERLPKKFEDMRPVRQPVQQSGREMFLPQHALPVAEFQVGGDDHGDTLVEGRAELEEEMGSLPAERKKAELIQHQQLLFAERGQQAREFQLVLRDDQVIDQGGHIEEAHPLPLSAGRQGQSCGNVAFPQTRVPNHENGFGVRDVAALGQLEHARLGDALYTVPVKLGQFFEHRKLRLGNAALHPIGITLSQFCFAERQ